MVQPRSPVQARARAEAGPLARIDPSPLRSSPCRGALLASGVTALLLTALLAGALAGLPGLEPAVSFRERDRIDLEIFAFALLITWLLVTTLTLGVFADPARGGVLTLGAAVLLRIALVLAVVFMFAFPFLPQLEGKSMTLRAVIYPILTAAIPVAYWYRGHRGPYPGVIDVAWTFTFTLDIVSNDLHWYGSWPWWDDWIHLVNAIPYTAVVVTVTLALERAGLLRVGFRGAVVIAFLVNLAGHAAWEMWEHHMDRFFGTELQPGGMVEASSNMLWALAGGVIGLALLAWWRRRGALESVIAPLARLVRRDREDRAREDTDAARA